MTPRIPPIVTRQIPPVVITTIEPPVTGRLPPVVTDAMLPPVIDVPNPTIEYPVVDVPTREQWEGAIDGGEEPSNEESTPNRPGVETGPIINVGPVEVPIPPVAPLITAGATAVVTTSVALGATIALNQVKKAAEPLIKQLLKPKKKKIKIKQVKPVLHFIPNEDGTTDVIQYSGKGMKVLESNIEKLEQYLRDQVDIDALWEYDNKIIIDEDLKKGLTKDGAKRFKKYFAAPKVIAKKLGAKFSF